MPKRHPFGLLTILVCLITLTGLFSYAASVSVDLVWDPSPDPRVTGYVIHYGSSTMIYTGAVDVGSSTNCTVTNLNLGAIYYFVVTAYDKQHVESDPSNELTVACPSPLTLDLQPNKALHIRFDVTAGRSYDIQTTSTFTNWTTIATIQSQSNTLYDFVDPTSIAASKKFYRLILH